VLAVDKEAMYNHALGHYGLAKAFVSKGENEESRHQHLFEEKARKTKKTKVCGF